MFKLRIFWSYDSVGSDFMKGFWNVEADLNKGLTVDTKMIIVVKIFARKRNLLTN